MQTISIELTHNRSACAYRIVGPGCTPKKTVGVSPEEAVSSHALVNADTTIPAGEISLADGDVVALEGSARCAGCAPITRRDGVANKADATMKPLLAEIPSGKWVRGRRQITST